MIAPSARMMSLAPLYTRPRLLCRPTSAPCASLAVLLALFFRTIVPVRSVLFPFAAILCLAPAAFPQPAFEVATIKPVDTKGGIANAGVSVYPGGRIVIHALSLKSLIAAAYAAGYWQLSGG